MATKILGVDLGTYSIKIVELDATSKSFTISNFIEIPLSADPTKDRTLETIEALRAFSAKYDPTSTRWIIGMPQSGVSVHDKMFPFRERAKIQKSLPFELEDDIPFDINDTVFDAKITEFDGSSARVLTVASPIEDVEKLLNLAKDCAIDAEIVSVEGLAMANVFESWFTAPPETSRTIKEIEQTAVGPLPSDPARVIMHLGHTRSLVLVYRGDVLLSIRSIFWGGAEIAFELGKVFSLSPMEALRALQTRSFILLNPAGASRDQLHMSQAVSSNVDNLIRETQITLLELRAQYNLEYQKIDLLGGVSQIQNLAPYIGQALGISTEISPSILSGRELAFGPTPHLDAVSPVALGLAIEGLKRPRNPAINLRKGELARENATLKRFWETWRVPVQVAAIAFGIFLVYSFVRDQIAYSYVETAEERLIEVGGKIANLKGASASQDGVERFIRTQKKKVRDTEALKTVMDYVPAMEILNKISVALPVQPTDRRKDPQSQAIDVSTLTIDHEDVMIAGHVRSPSLIPLIENALKPLAIGGKVEKTPAPPTPGGQGTQFAYKFKVARKP